MIIPVKCFTCGKVIGNMYEYYQKEVRKIKMARNMEVDKVVRHWWHWCERWMCVRTSEIEHWILIGYITTTYCGKVLFKRGHLIRVQKRRHMLWLIGMRKRRVKTNPRSRSLRPSRSIGHHRHIVTALPRTHRSMDTLSN